MKFFRKGNLETAFTLMTSANFYRRASAFFLALKGEFYVIFNFNRHYFIVRAIARKSVSQNQTSDAYRYVARRNSSKSARFKSYFAEYS